MTRTTNQISSPNPLVTLAEAKDHLRILHNDDDSYISSLLHVAQLWAESDTDCIFSNTTYKDTFSTGGELLLAKQPVRSITSVLDADDNPVDYTSFITEVGFSSVATSSACIVIYETGLIRPMAIKVAKQLVLLLVGQMFNFRELEVTTQVYKASGYEHLVNCLKVVA